MSINNDSYLTEQSHRIEFINIVNNDGEAFDVTENMLSMDVYEDIRGGASTLDLTVFDAHGFIIQMNLNGGETVNISFTSIDQDGGAFPYYTKSYRVINLIEVDDDTGKGSLLGFKCISEAVYNNSMRTISKSFIGLTTSEMIKRLMVENLAVKEPLLLEATKHKRDYIVPFVNPFTAINYLLTQSTSAANNTGDFMFYENIDGWNLRTFESMRTGKYESSTHKLIITSSQYKTSNFNHIGGYGVTKHFDIWSDSLDGYNDIDLTIVDPLTKTYESKAYNINGYRKTITNVNGIYPPAPFSTLKQTGTRATETFNFFPTIKDMQNQRVSRNFDSLCSAGKVIDLTIPANVAIKAGDLVYVDILNNDAKTNPKLAGKYIVKSLRHQVARSVMYTHMQVVKDSEQEK
ncbi:baseplate protein [Paraglaciecola Antarctic GD virus 1]|nr:baseplate protein [Paraglaciecola Antarctic GD virus 1]